MNSTKNHLDNLGQLVIAGDEVTLLEAPAALFNELPEEDQIAIKAQVGKKLKINEFDVHGNAELEFLDHADVTHFIWLETKYLVK